jgi:NADH-quinone oxidoreductase subunit L
VIRNAWLIPVFPLASFVLIFFLGKRAPGKGAPFGILAMFASWIVSLGVLWDIAHGHQAVERSMEWFSVGSFHLELGMAVDGLAAVMFVVVTTVSLAVQVYSLGYMKDDIRFTWFYAVLSLFTAAMLNVVIANNLFQLLVGWEVMGVCSYFLIGHWWEERTNSNAAIKAFITTRTGDIPFLFGIFVLTVAAGFDTNIGHITEMAESGHIPQFLLTAGALLLFGGAIGKSAQFPLHVWLPDAMAGPTPVSALIHAATMVAAGVYLVGRMFLVFIHAGAVTLQFVSVIACITMLIAALLAVIQDDLKRVLAYSTVSQLAYMVAGLSLGEAGYTAGLFHLFTHAFFKALLFLGAGSVIHAVHSNNMSEMGGLRKKMPITFWTFIIGSAALMGIPPLAGFWSKDEILTVAFESKHYLVWGIGAVTAILTGFYMTRAVLLTFFGEYRGHAHPHESPVTITAPLIGLSALAAGAGLLNASAFHWHAFSSWVHIGPEAHEGEFNSGIAGISILGALAAIAVGYRLYARWRERDPVRNLGPVYTLLENKYYLDALYMGGIVRPIRDRLSAAVNWFNQNVLDGVVHGFAWLARQLAKVVNVIDKKGVDGAVNGVAGLTGYSGGLLRYIQTGNVQWYAVALFIGAAAAAIVFSLIK